MDADRGRRASTSWILAALLLTIWSPESIGQSPVESFLPEWLPTELPAGEEYAGSAACVPCHTEQASEYAATAMANALQPAADSEILASRQEYTLSRGPYRYRIETTGGRSVYSVTDGTDTIATDVLWSFGQGKAGQTYIFERDGAFYESRVSYYLEIDGLDWTIGAPVDSLPRSLEEAAGRRMTEEDIRGCFGCHATGVVQDAQVSLDRMSPGISCEGCHGPARRHVEVRSSGRVGDAGMERLTGAQAEDQANFCGSCHRTWSQVVMLDIQGVNNVRFQPYRLVNSACYDAEDPKIRCAACHDPHDDPSRDSSDYDSKCLDCHRTVQGTASLPSCPDESANCSSCHMPKYEMPGSHFAFTDHWIRVAREGEGYPN